MNTKRNKPKSAKLSSFSTKSGRSSTPANPGFWASKSTRETVESIVVAFILAFLFRTFEAEAFVIPTGSMAPTLMGRHKDVFCWQCGNNYRASASDENADNRYGPKAIVQCRCPMCGYVMDCHAKSERNRHRRKERTYNGDRILVSKFSYQIGDPERWDVIVFKYPGNAKMNYIKRLVGLPNEVIHIEHGDVFFADNQNGEAVSEFRIARKSPHKLLAMLQLVHDNQYCPGSLLAAGWPTRWQKSDGGESSGTGWTEEQLPDKRQSTRSRQKWNFQGGEAGTPAWIRYGAYSPRDPDYDLWNRIERGTLQGRIPTERVRPQYVFDHYEYNESNTQFGDRAARPIHWVGDLALEAELEVEQAAGNVSLELIEGGHRFRCQFDLSTGQARLSINDGEISFVNEAGEVDGTERIASTSVQGRGSYRVMLSNCDDQLLLWVNGKVVSFDDETAYAPLDNHDPQEEDRWPAGIGAQNTSLTVKALRVYRDVYYVSVNMTNRVSPLRDTPGGVTFAMADDEFFVLGDNSPASQDSRLWRKSESDPHWVDRDLLIGKALFIYWPHSRADIFPFCPNIPRMGFVR